MGQQNNSGEATPGSATATASEVFPDGAMIELVRRDDGPLELLYYDGASTSIAPRVDRNGKLFVPPAEDEGILKDLQLPGHAIDYGSTRQLFDDLRRFFAQHPGLPEESILKLAYLALAIWFSECAAIWPFVSVVSVDSSGLTLLLRLLQCAYRRSLHVGEITFERIWSLPLLLRPTLLIDQPRPTRELYRVLRAMSRLGALVPQNGQLRHINCPTVICTAEPLTDPWILDHALHIVLTPTCGLPRIDPQTLIETARELQGKQLRYRLDYFAKVRRSQFDAPELPFP
ncbi:MAG: hypothetical protein WBC04_00320 [Candidatus Acidiferrales bacterium]